MEARLESRPSFLCLGLEAEGPVADPVPWVAALWGRFWGRSGEIRLRGGESTWGLMSDVTLEQAPWGGELGRYFAGVEVPVGTPAPEGWSLKRVPSATWLRVACLREQIPEAVDLAHRFVAEHPQWRWGEAVHELYPAGYLDPGRDELFLMVELFPR